MSSDNPAASEQTAELVTEKKLQSDLVTKFEFLADKVTIQRVRRVWVDVPLEQLHPVLVHAKEQLGFFMLCTITGTDEGETLGMLYHLANEAGVVLNLCIKAPKDGPGPETITAYFPHAELYEREVVDLLGVRIQGLPPGNRYPLPDGWPEGQYPLRKDWSRDAVDAPKETKP
jgi:Ni,Fe-hydrogenase III component G